MKYLVLIFVTFALISCSETTYRVSATVEVKTALPTATETVQPVLPTKTATATPFAVPVLEALQSSIKALSPAVDDLPSWMKSPDTRVLAALITDDMKGIRTIAFFNAATGEKYEMSMPYPARGFFWYDNMNFGLLSQNLETAYRINLQSGQIDAEALSSQSTRLLDKDLVNGVVRFEESPNEFVFDNRSRSISMNKTFAAAWVDGTRKNIVVTDTKTNEVVWKSATPENVWTISFLWSPTEDSHLAFLQGSPKADSDFITENISLIIVDVTSGETIATYSDDFGRLEWSPDGKKILYLDAMVHYNSYTGYDFQDAPCILFLATGEKRCLRAIPRLVPEGYKLESTDFYKWGIDSEIIFYTYFYVSQSNEEETLGNLCMYSLATSYITCPTQNLKVIQGSGIGDYNISPDQKYIYFCYSNSINDIGFGNDGIIKFDGSGFFSWTGTIQDQGPTLCSWDTLWRPLP